MKKIYSRPLFRLVEDGMKKNHPEFKLHKLSDKSDQAYQRVYYRNIHNKAIVYLNIVAHLGGYDEFYGYFGWSTQRDFPAKEELPSDFNFPMLDPLSAFEYPEIWDGIQRLWGDQGIGRWAIPTPSNSFDAKRYAGDNKAAIAEKMRLWEVERNMTVKDGEMLVQPLVEDFFAKLNQYVFPYLGEYANYICRANYE